MTESLHKQQFVGGKKLTQAYYIIQWQSLSPHTPLGDVAPLNSEKQRSPLKKKVFKVSDQEEPRMPLNSTPQLECAAHGTATGLERDN